VPGGEYAELLEAVGYAAAQLQAGTRINAPGPEKGQDGTWNSIFNAVKKSEVIQ
jgi:hypothetical protein